MIACLPSVFIQGCKHPSAAAPGPEFISLGPLGDFPEGTTDNSLYRISITRRGTEIFSTSLVCTHQECLLQRLGENLRCPCHGSLFGKEGAVMQGPAKEPLAHFRLSVNAQGELFAHFGERVSPEWRLNVA